MRFIIISVMFSLICLSTHSQEVQPAVSFVSYWSLGDTYQFQVSKIKQQWRGSDQTKNDTTQYVVTFEVIDSTADSYTIRWSHENDMIESYDIPTELMERFAKYNLTEVIYTTTEMGAFTGIQNWEAISELMSNMMNDVIEVMAESKGIARKDLKKAIDPFIAIYSTKEGIEQLAYKEIQYFHFPFGLEYDVKERIEYEEKLPNMFGGAPIKADAAIYFESVDYDNGQCVMINEMKMNQDDTKKMILKLFNQMGLKDKEVKQAMKTAKFTVNDNNRLEYYYYPGVPINIHTDRETVIDIQETKTRRKDELIIELLN